MQITYNELKEKILGCFNGKNIGGTLGAPFECYRQINDVSFYVQENIHRNPPPNDDLDLQIVWLNAVERFGASVNGEILAEYWLTYIYPRWSEYGAGKANLIRGFRPPISGRIENVYKDSCGSFIRSEIWACLAPGHPEIASVYAWHDSSVDHATDGTYGEVFCAAVQSAAFAESDIRTLINIGLSYIPENCLVSKAVRLVCECYDGGLGWKETREKLFCEVPGSFGLQTLPLEKWTENDYRARPGCDAPNNIGIAVIGLLYGGGDFGKSICLAVNCGEDTDCSAGFAGALLGIIYGNAGIPKKWSEVLDGVINTCCIDLSEWGFFLPKTVGELTDRILFNIPRFLQPDYAAKPLITFSNEKLYSLVANESKELFRAPYEVYGKYMWRNRGERRFDINELLRLPEYCECKEFASFKAVLEYERAPYIKEEEKFGFTLKLICSDVSRSPHWADVRVYTGKGLRTDCVSFSVPLQNTYRYVAKQDFSVSLTEFHGSMEDIIVEISLMGRHTYGVIKATLAVADSRDVTAE
ncbi:MAG: ADP-ribosylglycohydrolase family protein [Clostridia bacterium]|nr:ADP-ribosylglycohydrolase family protein [Clostridia bacterium]